MELVIYDTLTRQKRRFDPLVPGQVSFYTCGVTVYDYCHIGHARVYVTTDTMRRVLLAAGYSVRYVQNFTDIDDKIINRAAEAGIEYHTLTQRFIDAYMEDMGQLGISPADCYPRATEYLPQMIEMIGSLVASGHAYVSDTGDVWYSVDTFEGYGRLSRKKRDELIAGVRVDAMDGKRHPSDFVLWKSAKPGEPTWESPWGPGRPGWHIECSAMARQELGESIDIHAGGEDLIFPHHENEICQSEAVTHKPFVRYWVHNGFVTIDNEKMSKSLGNFFTIRDVLTQVSGQALRFFLLRSHYRTPLHYSLDGVKEAKVGLDKLVNTVNLHRDSPEAFGAVLSSIEVLKNRFWQAVSDDFNFSEAIGVLFDLSRMINTSEVSSGVLAELMGILGLESAALGESITQEAEDLMKVRWDAKQNRDFGTADRLRIELLERFQILVEDTKTEYRWKKLT